MKFIVKDYVPGFEKKIKRVFEQSLIVGITEKTAPRDDGADKNNAEIGYMTEFGVPEENIPQRAVLQPGLDNAKYDIGLCFAQAIKASLEGKPYMTWIERAGEIGVESVKDLIKAGNFVPLSQFTLAMRRARGNNSEAPLIDTGRFINAFTYEIIKNKK